MADESKAESGQRKPELSERPGPESYKRPGRWRLAAAITVGAVVITGAAWASWLGLSASRLTGDLNYASQLLPQLKSDVIRDDVETATRTVEDLRTHTASARGTVNDPLWTLAQSLPWIGINFQAATEVATAADDVARLAAAPLVSVSQSLEWRALTPSSVGTDLRPLAEAQPKLTSAAHAVRQSSDRLNSINATELIPQVSAPLIAAREQLSSLRDGLDAAADAARIAPDMMGSQTPRRYLLLIQNNAEARATGGIPGALAVVTLDNGKVTLGSQTTATAVGPFNPPIEVSPEQQQIYSARLGKFMQDATLTPDFPTAASTAQAMWESKTGQRVDGVISIDPVALGYILDATGPIRLTSPELLALAGNELPTELTGKNVVPTLLSDVYAKIERPQLQDAYFAGVAQELFSALSSGKAEPKGLLEGITRGTAEGRVLVWSDKTEEQSVLLNYPVSGSIAGPSVLPAQFGVYFNDGTGAKMDYYVKRTVQLVEECTGDEYGQIKVRITSTNTAPADAASSLPAYVTGDGAFGIPPGTVQTNVIAYGPVQANVETAMVDGKKTDFAAHRHSNRPVGSVTVTLAPGQSSTVELTFGKIVQHTEPNLVVTPTVQPVKDVVLGTQRAECVPGK